MPVLLKELLTKRNKMINELAKTIHQNAKNKGFFDTEKNIGEMLCLIHSEVSEALEADRKNHYTELPNIQLKGIQTRNTKSE